MSVAAGGAAAAQLSTQPGDSVVCVCLVLTPLLPPTLCTVSVLCPLASVSSKHASSQNKIVVGAAVTEEFAEFFFFCVCVCGEGGLLVCRLEETKKPAQVDEK